MQIGKIILLIFMLSIILSAQSKPGLQIARLKYDGGGDWYNDPSSEENLLKYINEHTTIKVNATYVFVEASSDDIFLYPILFITGHGNIVFSDEEVKRIKLYLENGGFIYIDDDYGLDRATRREFKKIFPDKKFLGPPFCHKIFSNLFYF